MRSSSLDEKRADVTGRELYEFIRFCEGSLPAHSTYKFIGLPGDSLAHRRVVYYLYPNTPSSSPKFLLVYKTMGYAKDGYRLFKTIADDKYILIKAVR